MPDQSHKQTPYDQFNLEIPQKFPEQGISAAAANAIVNSETWTVANPMLNLSSFVTTYSEPEAKSLYEQCIEISPIPTRIQRSVVTLWI
jgi:glutamate decarboxylase